MIIFRPHKVTTLLHIEKSIEEGEIEIGKNRGGAE